LQKWAVKVISSYHARKVCAGTYNQWAKYRLHTDKTGWLFRNGVLQLCIYKKLSRAHEDIVQTLLFTRSVFARYSELLCALQ